MTKQPVLVVMAAGMGSRYGGLKQIDPVGSHGEAILDYSLFDAYRAGFRTAVIVIKESIRAEFMETVGRRLEHCPMEIRWVFQELDMLPEGFSVLEGRVRPWGTAHAVLCAKEAVGKAPFALINADDFYGAGAFRTIYDYLCRSEATDDYDYCMVGYRLDKTVTKHGYVSRGVCELDENHCLARIHERKRVETYPGGIHYTLDGEHWVDFAADTVVSMNLWGFMPSLMRELEKGFPVFLEECRNTNPMQGEYMLSLEVSDLVQAGKARVEVLTTDEQWFGVTYAADRPVVQEAIRRLTQAGVYPDGLWK